MILNDPRFVIHYDRSSNTFILKIYDVQETDGAIYQVKNPLQYFILLQFYYKALHLLSLVSLTVFESTIDLDITLIERGWEPSRVVVGGD